MLTPPAGRDPVYPALCRSACREQDGRSVGCVAEILEWGWQTHASSRLEQKLGLYDPVYMGTFNPH